VEIKFALRSQFQLPPHPRLHLPKRIQHNLAHVLLLLLVRILIRIADPTLRNGRFTPHNRNQPCMKYSDVGLTILPPNSITWIIISGVRRRLRYAAKLCHFRLLASSKRQNVVIIVIALRRLNLRWGIK
jgi:hypothetical protein